MSALPTVLRKSFTAADLANIITANCVSSVAVALRRNLLPLATSAECGEDNVPIIVAQPFTGGIATDERSRHAGSIDVVYWNAMS